MAYPSLIQIGVFISVLGLIACSDSRVDQLKSETAKMKQSIAEKEEKMNHLRQGGQPGIVKINIAENPGSTEELNKIIITASPGKSLDGSIPDLKRNQIQIATLKSEQELNQFNFSEIQQAGYKTINIGCDEKIVSAYSDDDTLIFDEQTILPNLNLTNNGSYDLTATTVLLCKTEILQKHDISIKAKTVVMNGFNYQSRKDSSLFHTLFKIVAENLILNDVSKISSLHEPSLISAMEESGSIEITAKRISGDGQLHIETIGADGL
ncbi:MAG: hypothetical protein BroJett041_23570 [Candidatus Jettenia caeni]|nr:MAG: hypothetical protein BroJett041_23570 [Candidatus Jettenia caeni]